MKERILVIEDEKRWCDFLSLLMSQAGYEPTATTDSEEGVKLALGQDFSLVLTDLRMPKLDGIEVLKKIKSGKPSLPVIIITAYSTVGAAIESMKQGAFDYITKPFNNEQVMSMVSRAISQAKLERENGGRVFSGGAMAGSELLVGKSGKMQELYKLIGKVSGSNATVLIRGESGTGKELIARTIHKSSPRSSRPFVVVDCSALTETLLESELFGHVKGSFTGAFTSKKGLIEEAESGTIFLDEIGNVSSQVQMDLLRFLQSGEIKRVGDNKWRKVEVRMIAATNQDLEQMISSGAFREDLYYRLNVVSIIAPPLRERKDDIPLLVEHFISKHNQLAGLRIQGISSEAIQLLVSYDWPGNVRELENILARAMTLARGKVLMPEDLPLGQAAKPASYQAGIGFKKLKRQHVENFEAEMIRYYLENARGNVSAAARLAQIPRQSFHRLMKKYRIRNPRLANRPE